MRFERLDTFRVPLRSAMPDPQYHRGLWTSQRLGSGLCLSRQFGDLAEVCPFTVIGALIGAIKVAVVAPDTGPEEWLAAGRQEAGEGRSGLQVTGCFGLLGHPRILFFSASSEGLFGTVKKTRTFRFAHLGHLRNSARCSSGNRSPRVHTRVVMSSSTDVSHQGTNRSERFAGPNHEQCAVHRQPSFHASPNVSTGIDPVPSTRSRL